MNRRLKLNRRLKKSLPKMRKLVAEGKLEATLKENSSVHLTAPSRSSGVNLKSQNLNLVKKKKPPQIVWNLHYAALLEFKKGHGHCLIPKIHTENQPLSSWVFRQRAEYKKRHQNGGRSSYLTDERVAILEEQGFAR